MHVPLRISSTEVAQFIVVALVGFQGRGHAGSVSPEFCPTLLLEALIVHWP
jgi:hypothetical protein